MGEAKNRSRSRASVLAAETRCIYCAGAPETLEHMPPRAMFRAASRPSGLEFGTCLSCNNGTSAADLVASFAARLIQGNDDPTDWHHAEARGKLRMLRKKTPDFLLELFRPEKSKEIWQRSPGGVLTKAVSVHADGPSTKAYLDVFSAKLGMALYREHVGAPIPMEGGVHSRWFLNAGLAQETADSIMHSMPMFSTLKQGGFEVPGQFGYRYNCDLKSIFAAMVWFHTGLFVFTIAAADPDTYDLRSLPDRHSSFFQPGRLLAQMPKPQLTVSAAPSA
ncbi:MAG TPA: hypothetical protein VF459_11475 [Caulobacteraceae bacterium]